MRDEQNNDKMSGMVWQLPGRTTQIAEEIVYGSKNDCPTDPEKVVAVAVETHREAQNFLDQAKRLMATPDMSKGWLARSSIKTWLPWIAVALPTI